jgi:hypothetical protein
MKALVEGERVRILRSIETLVKAGEIGVVCALYDGSAYEVRFAAPDGSNFDMLLTADEIELADGQDVTAE